MAKSRVAVSSSFPVIGGKTQALTGAIGALAPAALAWEFLRRNPVYVADYQALRAGRLAALPEHWGLARPTDPEVAKVDHRTLWRTPARGATTTPPAARSATGFPRANARR
ncbi:transcriptional regulator domain-containing protein [Caulobacter segnis]|uniref:transcriptional regulator domain-containing protein n=1 Tax=Caulobacter segnis TaxID=88688 RepID=UPI003857410B